MGANVSGQSRVRGTVRIATRKEKNVTVLRPGHTQKIVGHKPLHEIVQAYLESKAKHNMLAVKVTLDGGLIIQVVLDSIVPGNGQHDFHGFIANGNEIALVQGKFYATGGEFTVLV